MGYNGVTVLVVEDEVLVRLDIVQSLEDGGFNVLEASNADDAIIVFEAHPEVRLMFTDIDMPRSMDGLKLPAAVRNRWPPVQIIVSGINPHIDQARLAIRKNAATTLTARMRQLPSLMDRFERENRDSSKLPVIADGEPPVHRVQIVLFRPYFLHVDRRRVRLFVSKLSPPPQPEVWMSLSGIPSDVRHCDRPASATFGMRSNQVHVSPRYVSVRPTGDVEVAERQ